MINVGEILLNLWNQSGFAALFQGFGDGGWQNLVMIIIACVLLYLGIGKKFEPLLMVGIAFGCLLSNLPLGGLYHPELWDAYINETPYLVLDELGAVAHTIEHIHFTDIIHYGGLLDIF